MAVAVTEIIKAEDKLAKINAEIKRVRLEWEQEKERKEFERQVDVRRSVEEQVRLAWSTGVLSLQKQAFMLRASVPVDADFVWFTTSDWQRLEETKQVLKEVVSLIEKLQQTSYNGTESSTTRERSAIRPSH
ncbi:MAG TPA: hypothetical protein VEP90_09010 [Methylomirabilota bacterium]|nr:hypothetical protein [Methylomirabilota bacterium]